MPDTASERQFVKVNVEDRVAVITIDHPPVNAFDGPTMLDLHSAVGAAIEDPEVKAIVITGAGQMAFVAGADIGAVAKLENAGQALQASLDGQTVFNRIECSPKPVIAAINGVCLGGGMELALACHMRIAGDRVRMGQPEINLGIIPAWGGTQRLPRLVGQSKAIELILTGDALSAQEAYRLNLVNKVVPGGEVLKTAKDLAKKIASKGGPSVSAALEAIRKSAELPLDDGLQFEAERFGALAETEDMKEGVGAFLQKRQPVFKDR